MEVVVEHLSQALGQLIRRLASRGDGGVVAPVEVHRHLLEVAQGQQQRHDLDHRVLVWAFIDRRHQPEREPGGVISGRFERFDIDEERLLSGIPGRVAVRARAPDPVEHIGHLERCDRADRRGRRQAREPIFDMPLPAIAAELELDTWRDLGERAQQPPQWPDLWQELFGAILSSVGVCLDMVRLAQQPEPDALVVAIDIFLLVSRACARHEKGRCAREEVLQIWRITAEQELVIGRKQPPDLLAISDLRAPLGAKDKRLMWPVWRGRFSKVGVVREQHHRDRAIR